MFRYFPPLKLKMFICRPRLVLSHLCGPQPVWPLTPDVNEVFSSTRLPGLVKSRITWLSSSGIYSCWGSLCIFWCSGVGLDFLYVSFDLWDSVYLFWQILWVLTFTCLSRLSAQLLCYLLYLGNIIQENLLWLSCFHLGLNNLFLILKLVLQPHSSFLTALRLLSLIENANMDKIWYEMTDYCGVWGNPIISSNPIIIMDDVPFCTREIFSDFSDNYICMSEKQKKILWNALW